MTEITLYRFADAPPFLRRVSTNGGDEDWVAVSETRLPESARSMLLPRANILDEYFLDDENLWVYIGAHS